MSYMTLATPDNYGIEVGYGDVMGAWVRVSSPDCECLTNQTDSVNYISVGGYSYQTAVSKGFAIVDAHRAGGQNAVNQFVETGDYEITNTMNVDLHETIRNIRKLLDSHCGDIDTDYDAGYYEGQIMAYESVLDMLYDQLLKGCCS